MKFGEVLVASLVKNGERELECRETATVEGYCFELEREMGKLALHRHLRTLRFNGTNVCGLK